ncbi:hypothetical protein [Larkinella punicea]|uniref:Sigma-70 family RNA polymerase sigma factor n=1 Tax=Larkinella punicea TaxID=2315727 RepID=A0A368JUW2_9BACT|nr:hypothetical protein [Larkinella punicea]RCR71252.1 hypothetical protein DUE52_03110 [Larkinella punicea]
MNKNVLSSSITELRQKSDEALLKLIALREENESLARAAFQVFYERYEQFLFGVARNVSSQFPGSSNELFEAVFQNTFMKVYLRAETFNPSEVKASDMTLGIKAWIGRIADNEHKLLLRQLRNRPAIQLVADVPIAEEDLENIPADEGIEEPVSYERSLLDQALATLNDMERYILVQSSAYEQEGKYLPSTFIDATCMLWHITKVNFRKVKSVARRKVVDKINQLRVLKNK